MDDVRGDLLRPPHGTTPAVHVVLLKNCILHELVLVMLYVTKQQQQQQHVIVKPFHLLSIT